MYKMIILHALFPIANKTIISEMVANKTIVSEMVGSMQEKHSSPVAIRNKLHIWYFWQKIPYFKKHNYQFDSDILESTGCICKRLREAESNR